MSSRELLTLQIGKAGNYIAHEFWKDLCQEHHIFTDSAADMGRYSGPPGHLRQQNIDVFFHEVKSNAGFEKYIPRNVGIDLNTSEIQGLRNDKVGQLYSSDSLIASDEGSSNCYAKAFYTTGPSICEAAMDQIRKQIEGCNSLQGVQVCHALAGGTGSGLTGLILKELKDTLSLHAKCVQTFTIMPSAASETCIGPYNAALGIHDLQQYSDNTYVLDNSALQRICQQTLKEELPSMSKLNNIIAYAMSGLTSGLRFPGHMNSDLRKINTNLVAFKGSPFLLCSVAPLVSNSSKTLDSTSTSPLALAQQMMSPQAVCASVNTLYPGNVNSTPPTPPSKIISCFAAFRGDLSSSDVEEVLYNIQDPRNNLGATFDKFFPDWIPGSIAHSLCSVPHVEFGNCVTCVQNNTAVKQVFENINYAFKRMMKKGAYMEYFRTHGMEDAELDMAVSNLEYLKDMYENLERLPDKLVVNGQPNQEAIRTPEQQLLMNDYAGLQDCYIKSSTLGGATLGANPTTGRPAAN